MKTKPTATKRQKSDKTAAKKAKGLTDLEIKGKLTESVRGGGTTLFSAVTSQQKLK
jgi:hypothetical protein